MKRTIIGAGVLALAVTGVPSALADKPEQSGKPAEGGFKVTGGGQIVADSAGGGAGDTVGFTAHDLDPDSDAARGQFQFVPRGQSTNDSAPGEKFHGVVTCLISGGEAQQNEANETDGEENEALRAGMARFGGYVRGSDQAFTVDVSDDGQGSGSNDMILVRFTSEPCADNPENEEDEPEELLKLGRGNVKIHNNPDGAATPAAALMTSAALAALAR